MKTTIYVAVLTHDIDGLQEVWTNLTQEGLLEELSKDLADTYEMSLTRLTAEELTTICDQGGDELIFHESTF